MGLAEDLAAFSLKLDSAIIDGLENEVTTQIQAILSGYLESHTFKKSRGQFGMGVRDVRNMNPHVEQNGNEFTLKVVDEAEFQAPPISDSDILAEAVEYGDARYHMKKPRPFIRPTQKKLDSGESEELIATSLRLHGFDCTTV